MAAWPHHERHELVRQELLRQLGSHTQVISLEPQGEQRVRGLAVCSGRILSYVLDAQSSRLSTRPLFNLLLHSRR
jgi:transposase